MTALADGGVRPAIVDEDRAGEGDLRAALRHALRVAAELPGGSPTGDVPVLRRVDKEALGIAFAPASGPSAGGCVGAAAWRRAFSLQSVAKVFALVLLLAEEPGAAAILDAAPGNEDHRSTLLLDPRRGRAPGPFTNAGALLVVDRLLRHHDDVASSVADLISEEAAEHEPAGAANVDEAVAASELAACHRNRALAHLLAERGLLTHDVDDVLRHYVRLCAIAASCRAVALAGGLLAREGDRRDGRRLLTPPQARRLNAVMLTSGAYAHSGRYAVQIGLPLKTGVGGGVLAVVPRRGAFCAWSPGIDTVGTSRRGVAAIGYAATALGLSLF